MPWAFAGDQGSGYDAALASMELALILLEQRKNEELARLAIEMNVILRAEVVHREAAAALTLFCQAARAQSLDRSILQRVRAFLEEARFDPEASLAEQ